MGRSPSLANPFSKLLKYNRIFQFAPLARREIFRQRDGPVTNADEAIHPAAGRLEKTPHLAVASLREHHAIPAVGAGRVPFLPYGSEGGDAVFKLHPAAQLLQVGI